MSKVIELPDQSKKDEEPLRVLSEEESSILFKSLIGDINMSMDFAKRMYVILNQVEIDREEFTDYDAVLAEFEHFLKNKDPEWLEWFEEMYLIEEPEETGSGDTDEADEPDADDKDEDMQKDKEEEKE